MTTFHLHLPGARRKAADSRTRPDSTTNAPPTETDVDRETLYWEQTDDYLRGHL
jgi:hypothetical protein